MGRPKGSTKTPSYRLHKPTGQAVVSIASKDHYLGKFGSAESKAQYDRLIGEWLTAGRKVPAALSAGGLTINELIVAFWADYQRRPRQNTLLSGNPGSLDRMRKSLGLLRRFYGPTRVADFGPLALRTLLSEFTKQKSPITGIAWSRGTCNCHLRNVRQAFKWAVAHELADPGKYHSLRVIGRLKRKEGARDTDPVEPADDVDIEAVKDIAPPKIIAMISLLRLTGARVGEICMMRGVDIDMTTQPWAYRPSSHKNRWRDGSKPRVIWLGKKCQDVLSPWLSTNVNEFIFRPGLPIIRGVSDHERAVADAVKRNGGNRSAAARELGKKPQTINALMRRLKAKLARNPGELLPPRQKRSRSKHRQKFRGRYDSAAFGAVIRRLCDRAAEIAAREGRAFERWHAHQIRHTVATEIARAHGIEVAKVLLGHMTLKMTELYAAPDTDRAKLVMQQVG